MDLKKEILKLIAKDENVIRYKILEPLVNKDKNIKHQLAKIKQLQRQLVNAKHIGKKNLVDQLTKDYQNLLDELVDFPILQEYLDLQDYINDMINQTRLIFEHTLKNSNEDNNL